MLADGEVGPPLWLLPRFGQVVPTGLHPEEEVRELAAASDVAAVVAAAASPVLS